MNNGASTGPDGSRRGDDRPYLTVAEAADRLGVTHDALRGRLQRGSTPGEKVDGVWRVFLETVEATGPQRDTTGQRQDVLIDAVSRLEKENAYLKETLTLEIEARRRADILLASVMEKLPALVNNTTIPQDAPQASQDAPGRAEAPREAAEGLQKTSGDPEPSGFRGWLLRVLRG